MVAMELPHRPRVLLVEANDMPKWVGGQVEQQVHVIPIGLMYLAGAVEADGAASAVRIVESSLDCPTDAQVVALLQEFRPHVVGIRSIIFFVEELQRIARLVRRHSEARIVAGGPIVEAWGAALFDRISELDVLVRGEGEGVLPRLVRGEPMSQIEGVLWRDGGEVRAASGTAEFDDLDAIPLPAYHLVNLEQYRCQLSYAYNHRRQGVLVTGRGCVYRCTFCFRSPGRMRLRSAENVVREIEWLVTTQDVRDFYIVDDIFNVNPTRALEIFDRLVAARLGVRLYFVNGLRADRVSETFVDRAIEAGAVWFTYAIESGSEVIQTLTKKQLDLELARRMIAYTQRQPVVVNISTMYGFPGETREQAQETLDFLGRLPKPSVMPYHFCLRFFPGCEIREQALAAGWNAEYLDVSTECCYHDFPIGTPTLSRADMTGIVVEYHRRFGLNNPDACREAVNTLRSIGYADEEIRHLYSVLTRTPVADLRALVGER
jgi:anaerobic magnesium-protoporphyrin IX monomethyl ester cyclase